MWLFVDESTDLLGGAVANVLMGVLDNEEYHKPYLIQTTILERTDSGTIARFINETLKLVFPKFNEKLLKPLVTDRANR